MSRTWIHEHPARWDAEKARILGAAPSGSLTLPDVAEGALAPGEWWRVEDEGRVVGYGWMDVVWGEGEILLAVAPEAAGRGVGTFVLDHLAVAAAERGLRRIYNTVRPGHPERAKITAWLQARGFAFRHDDERLSRPVGG